MNKSLNQSFRLETDVSIENHWTGSSDDGRDESLAQAEVATLAVIFTVTVVGNVVVLLALWTRTRYAGRRKLSRMYFFIMHLSLADLVTAFCNVLPQLAWDITYRFYGGAILCKLVKFVQPLGPYLSSYILVATAVDRHQAICYPLTYCSWTSRRSKVMVWLAWITALVFCLPQLGIFSYKEIEPGVHDCWATFPQAWGERAYVTWYSISVFIVPLGVLVFTYSCICRVIWRSAELGLRGGRAGGGPGGSRRCGSGGRYSSPGGSERHSSSAAAAPGNSLSPSSQSQQAVQGLPQLSSASVSIRRPQPPLISRAKINTVKQTVAVIAMYIVCSSPFIGVQLWATWDPYAYHSPFFAGAAFTILTLLSSLNSCVNPWIYLAFNGELPRMLVRHYAAARKNYQQTGNGSASNSSNGCESTSVRPFSKWSLCSRSTASYADAAARGNPHSVRFSHHRHLPTTSIDTTANRDEAHHLATYTHAQMWNNT